MWTCPCWHVWIVARCFRINLWGCPWIVFSLSSLLITRLPFCDNNLHLIVVSLSGITNRNWTCYTFDGTGPSTNVFIRTFHLAEFQCFAATVHMSYVLFDPRLIVTLTCNYLLMCQLEQINIYFFVYTSYCRTSASFCLDSWSFKATSRLSWDGILLWWRGLRLLTARKFQVRSQLRVNLQPS